MFIVFEGTEGSGKSSMLQRVARVLRARGQKVVCTREPGGTKLSERIRPILLSTHMDPWSEVFFYQALRAEHVTRRIRPALEKGYTVLCDRFTDSTLAYQGAARGLNWSTLEKLNKLATGGLRPDLVCWLDVSGRLGLKRARERNRFEEEGVRFQEKARKGFARAMKMRPRSWIKLDSEALNQDAVEERLLARILPRILQR